MILPGPTMIRLQVVLVVMASVAAPVLFQHATTLALTAGSLEALLLLAFLIDGWMLPGERAFRAERDVPLTIQEGAAFSVTLRISAARPGSRIERQNWNLQVHDGLLPYLSSEDFPVFLRVRVPFSITYSCVANRRAVYALREVFMGVRSRAGLALRRFQLPVQSELVVHPIIPPVEEEFIAAQKRLIASQGQKRRQAPGGEREFYRLRDYVPGDERRHIDWKASARFGHPIAREYEHEQKQRLFLVVDCSRWMGVRSTGRSLLDEALSSALMLAGVASSRGDAVGFLAWSGGPLLYLPPAMREKGLLASAVARLQTESSHMDLNGLAAFLAGALRSECIVSLFTSVPHEEGATDWVHFAGKVSASHRPLLVMLENDETLGPLGRSKIAGLAKIARRGNLFPMPVIDEANVETAPLEEIEAVAIYQYLKEKERRLRLVAGKRFGVVYSTRNGLHPSVLGEYLRIRFAPTF